jgi:1-aminocyclopropane-1-carboxylate deaminase/D-cysteine desulfhydrase-like pyridoxal-dependent ACC family enzyme
MDCKLEIPFRENTPIEAYNIENRTIFVKRDDLYGQNPAPPLAKLRGLRLLLQKANMDGVRLVGCWDTRISKLGQGLAACCRETEGMNCIVSYPTKKGEKQSVSIQKAAELGAEIYPVPGGRITISFSVARRYVVERGGMMLPFGLECAEAVEGIRKEARQTPIEYLKGGTLIVCCGSGVTLAGLISGLPILPEKIIGISSGRSVKNIVTCIKRYVDGIPPVLELKEAMWPYSKALMLPCPFPTHPNYDLKAWKYLVDNLAWLREPILFWNIGA